MSLIYSAINSLEKKPSPDAVMVEAYAPPVEKTPSRWPFIVVVGVVSVSVLVGAVLFMSGSAPKIHATSAPVLVQQSSPPLAIATAPVSQEAPELVSEPFRHASPVIAQVVAPDKASAGFKPVQASRIKAQAAKAAALQSADQAANTGVKPAVQETSTAPQAAPAGVDVNDLVRAAQRAIDAGKKDEADSLLAKLAANVPAESITLLRLRAWQAEHDNNVPRAMQLYAQIVARLPGDEPASINLAVLNWKSGRHDEARRIVAQLAERDPDSALVQNYAAQFKESR